MHKWLLAWSVLLIGVAEIIRHVTISKQAAMITGGVEVLVASATGIAFGIVILRNNRDR